ncbi:hypothetical protein BKG83_15965 [Mycobacteroides chelonae]|nr:hypothetical protein BKG83_15965 [Mycobacteroides chelonae]PKQ58176.1 hypothetical protein B5566_09680 [Mycobacterium sp. MHSD3]
MKREPDFDWIVIPTALVSIKPKLIKRGDIHRHRNIGATTILSSWRKKDSQYFIAFLDEHIVAVFYGVRALRNFEKIFRSG